MSTMKNDLPSCLVEFAESHDAAIVSQARYGVAVQARLYRADGTREVRHCPDPCDFRSVEEWEKAIEAGMASRWVC